MEVLDRTYSIFVNDKLRGWRADGKAFPTHLRTKLGIEGETESKVSDDGHTAALATERSLGDKT